MIIKIIFLMTGAVILLLNFSQLQKLLAYDNHRILLTSIPYTEKDNPQIQSILSQAKRRIKIVRLLSFAILILYLLPGNEAMPIFVFIFHMFALQPLIFLALEPCFIQLRHWKATQSTYSSSPYPVNADKETSAKKPPFSLYTFLLPLVLICCGVVYGYSCSLSTDMIFFIILLGISALLPVLLSYFLFQRNSSDNFTRDTRSVDILSRENQKLSFFFSTLEAICFLFFCLFYCRNIYFFLPLYFYLGSIFLFQVLQWIFLRQNCRQRYLMTQENVMDDECYYDLLGYTNPNDRRIFVPSLTNGNILINRGNFKGKIVITLFFLTMVLLIGSFACTLWTDDVTVTFTSQNLSLRAFPYSDEIPLNEISSITLLPQLPSEHLVRTNSAGFASKRYGSFSMEGVGDVRLYLFQGPPYIEIKSRHSKPIYLNERNPRETLQLYEKLRNLLSHK